MVENPPANAGDGAPICRLGRSPGGGHGSSLRYSSDGWHSWALPALSVDSVGRREANALAQRLGRHRERSCGTVPSPALGTWVLLRAGHPAFLP